MTGKDELFRRYTAMADAMRDALEASDNYREDRCIVLFTSDRGGKTQGGMFGFGYPESLGPERMTRDLLNHLASMPGVAEVAALPVEPVPEHPPRLL